jgi:hypothetical protein
MVSTPEPSHKVVSWFQSLLFTCSLYRLHHGHAMEAIRKRDEEEAAAGVLPPGKRMKKA